MKKPSAFVLILSFLLLVLLPACNNSVDDMLEDYNGGFKEKYTILADKEDEKESSISPGEEGFDEIKMLREEYFVWEDSTLILAGPPRNVITYRWELFDPEQNFEQVAVNTIDGTVLGQYFRIYLPQSKLKIEHTYKLTLIIKSTGGVEYSDTCSIVVYKHYLYD